MKKLFALCVFIMGGFMRDTYAAQTSTACATVHSCGSGYEKVCETKAGCSNLVCTCRIKPTLVECMNVCPHVPTDWAETYNSQDESNCTRYEKTLSCSIGSYPGCKETRTKAYSCGAGCFLNENNYCSSCPQGTISIENNTGGSDSCCTPTSSTFTRWIVPDDNTNRYKFPIGCRRAVMNDDGTTCSCAEYEYKYACESTYYWDGQNCVRCPHVNVGDSNSYGKNSAGCNIELTTGTAKCLYEVSDAVKGMDKCYLPKLKAAGQQYSDATGTFEVADECHNYQ